jgi:hypothetical protein
VAHGLPALVANQYSVLDTSATHFAQQFYRALAHGMTIGQAAREARIAVNYSLQGESIDWAVPVVYARDPNMTLAVPPQRAGGPAATRPRVQSRRSVSPRPVEVGVWDIDNVFPALKSTLERLTGAQDRFGFDLVELSAPIDVWDLEQRADDGTPYLWAEKLAKRLSRTPLDLGVNVLACVTRHWLRDDDTLNLYGWWPRKGEAPVLVFSVAGFDGLAPEGAATDRAIANVLVAGLGGHLAGIDAHDNGAKDCPLWTNDPRDIKRIVAPQAFDRGCRAKLAKAIPDELPALDALLKVFR